MKSLNRITRKCSRLAAGSLLIFLATNSVKAQIVLDEARLDSLMNVLASNNKFMGCVTLAKAGMPIYNKAFGYADVENKKPAEANTRYRIGSISKMFTTAMIFQLIEEHKLTGATKLSKYYPQIPNAAKISIDQLLSHHSGIHNFTDSFYTTYYTRPQTHDYIISLLKKSKPEFAPGEKAEYSNSNFVLLGYIIEKITGKDYAKNLQSRICNKIGLKNTYYGGKISIDKGECYSYGFYNNSWQKEEETDMSIPGGAGSIVSTTNDLNTFINSLFKYKIVSKKSLEAMTKMQDGFGKGIFQTPFYSKIGYGHTGGIDGFSSALSYFPEDSLTVAFCANGMNYTMNDILIGILSIYYHKHYQIPSFKAVAVNPELLKKYEGSYAKEGFPLKLMVKIENGQLTAQATGQSAFPLDAVSDTEFKFDAAGITLVFLADGSQLTLKQAGQNIPMLKEK